MITLANSQGERDQDRKAVCDAVEASVWRTFLQLIPRALGEGPKAHHMLVSGRWTPSVCPGTPCPCGKGYSHHSSSDSSMKGANRRRAPRGLGRALAGRARRQGSLESVPRDEYHPSGSPPIAQTKPNTRLAEPRREHGLPQRSKVLRGEAGFTGPPLSSCDV
jgi:hypothetical protein